MITIESLQVLFDAERQRDEVRFAELFRQHIAYHDDRRERAADAEARAQCERAVGEARSGW
jgi:hypothetical protein